MMELFYFRITDGLSHGCLTNIFCLAYPKSKNVCLTLRILHLLPVQFMTMFISYFFDRGFLW